MEHEADELDVPGEKRSVWIRRARIASPLTDRRTTDYIIAVSGMETGFRWRIPDTEGKYVKGCARVGVGLENRAGILWRAWNNEQIRAWLLENGYVGGAVVSSRFAMAWSARVLQDPPLGRIIRSMFEDTLRYEWPEMLAHFSVGPTQCNMLGTGPTLGGEGPWRCWETTWDEIYTLYIKRTRSKLFERAHCYLGAAPSDESDTARIRWLARQTGGGTTTATKYYYGQGPWERSGGGWQNRLEVVRSVL